MATVRAVNSLLSLIFGDLELVELGDTYWQPPFLSNFFEQNFGNYGRQLGNKYLAFYHRLPAIQFNEI
jgi:hypothetical protein